jgi:hypothetical protein
MERFVALGVPPQEIVVAGQSFGGSAALIFAAQNPDRLNSVIVLLPGRGLAKFGRDLRVGNMRCRWQSVIRGIAVPALIYGVEGDDISPLQNLEFLAGNRSIERRRIANRNGGTLCDVEPRLFVFTSCFVVR